MEQYILSVDIHKNEMSVSKQTTCILVKVWTSVVKVMDLYFSCCYCYCKPFIIIIVLVINCLQKLQQF